MKNEEPSNSEPGTRNSELAEAIVLQWTWKTPAMKAMTLAICKLALDRAARGDARPTEFSANDLADFDHGGRGIAGAIFHRLAKDGVLAPVGAFVGPCFMPKFATNAGGNPVRVWRLANAGLARALLKVHGQRVPELKQAELV